MHYVWLLWSLLLIVIWSVVYFILPTKEQRREMLKVSLWTSLLGLTEPFFVPMYWFPESLFNLAARTGFDIESFIFSFGIGGLAAVLYELMFRTTHVSIPEKEHHSARHRFHLLTLISAPVIFVVLYFTTGLNPIYSAIIAMLIGGLATWYCRPDLITKMITSAFLFLALYVGYFWVLIAMASGYVEKVWNLKALSGILLFGIPAEELLFSFGFGFIWSSIYEHFTWKKLK